MFRKFFLALAAAAMPLAFTGAATATTYSIDAIVNTTANGFGSSMFHDQTSGQMNGTILAAPTGLVAGGTWNSVTGAISFSFNVDGGTATANGTLTVNPTRIHPTSGYTGVSGDIGIEFSGTSQFDTITEPFKFADTFFTPEPNGTDFTQISLWGDLGNYSASTCSAGSPTCVGLDLRLEISAIPLPAPALLLLAGLGGLGALRRKR